jgi:hypothetical protein
VLQLVSYHSYRVWLSLNSFVSHTSLCFNTAICDLPNVYTRHLKDRSRVAAGGRVLPEVLAKVNHVSREQVKVALSFFSPTFFHGRKARAHRGCSPGLSTLYLISSKPIPSHPTAAHFAFILPLTFLPTQRENPFRSILPFTVLLSLALLTVDRTTRPPQFHAEGTTASFTTRDSCPPNSLRASSSSYPW